MKKMLTLHLRAGAVRRLQTPVLVGILNATPDSFYDGDPRQNAERLTQRAARMAAEGVPWVDLGGESTRPGSHPVPLRTELNRVIPMVRLLRERHPDLIISIDTTKATVADGALGEGAHLVNDTSAGLDSEGLIFETVARHRATIILMHRQGEPGTMQKAPRYQNVLNEVVAFLKKRAAAAMKAGIPRGHIIVDPGIGFGKDTAHNVRLLTSIKTLRALGFPVMIGASMKRIVGDLTGREPPERLAGTLALHLAAAKQGAHALRLHEPWHMKDTLAVSRALGQLD